MVNEVLQWVVLAVAIFLLAGVFRQLSLMVPAEARAVSPVRNRVPKRTLTELRDLLHPNPIADGLLIAFVSESCIGCHHLLANLTSAQREGRLTQTVLITRPSSIQFRSALEETGLPTLVDDRGGHWAACGVTATPYVIKTNMDGTILGREVTHRVEEFADAVNQDSAAGASRL
jgi:hypothetical protein